jgi:hypothetical protein
MIHDYHLTTSVGHITYLAVCLEETKLEVETKIRS